MADHKIIVSATAPDGSDVSKTITDINPDAGNTQLKNFGQMLNGLTDNVYSRTDRVIKIHCDSEASDGKQTPTFSLTYTNNGTSVDLLENTWNINARATAAVLTYDGDGEVYLSIVQAPGSSGIQKYCAINRSEFNANHEAYIGAVFDAANTNTYTLKILVTETDTFKGVNAEITIQANVA